MRNRLLLTSLLILISGCSVYKSSDRDDFNQHAKERAPAAQSLSVEDQELLANPCAAFDGVRENDLAPLFGSPIHLTMTNQISRKTSTCLVTNHEPSVGLQSISLLACSWKPVDGEPVPTSPDSFSVQTTEDDLHDQGFSVVTTTATSGDRLRMNCEAYVPTGDLLEDRKANETGMLSLIPKFGLFTDELKLSTLSSDGAR